MVSPVMESASFSNCFIISSPFIRFFPLSIAYFQKTHKGAFPTVPTLTAPAMGTGSTHGGVRSRGQRVVSSSYPIGYNTPTYLF